MASQQPPSAVDPESPTPQDKPRFGLKPDQRLPYIALATFGTGMGIGAFHGSQTASYRFRAENAHRFPTTNKGWFLYHKDKSNLRLVTAVKEGFKMGAKLGAGALAFGFFEETVDKARNDRDFLSTVTAGLTFSGIYSVLARHDVYTAARTAKFGLKFGLAYGLLQDLLETLKGKQPKYVDFILGDRLFKKE
ncbi:hypothetical protein P170DRAFT_478587 [Aspergillus steynii IBT 23096]|uniref:Uncharacterized protein n=1 Tax=Aspergillus steynii IBT 23096 TaxID=1392250 RepID=A0A2I2FYB5_9EURO|nr:uncharacterized protein P170DRAFT_478587 [Aspergillus steynii IBT 23096]PLB45634.1 hypothetical protein P170DRAFT_478587 [Aspergillus steynii IBT 23096]